MKPEKGGNATGPPKIGRAIIGATLLLKGDAFAPSDQPQGAENAPKTAQGTRIRLELPATGFGKVQPVAPRVAIPGRTEKAPKVRPPYAYAPPAQLPPFHPPTAATRVAMVQPERGRASSRQPPTARNPLFDLPPVQAAEQPRAAPAFSQEPSSTTLAESPAEAAPPPAALPEPTFGPEPAPPAPAANLAAAAPEAATVAPTLPEPQFAVSVPPPEASIDAPTSTAPPSAGEIAAAQLASPPRYGPQASPAPLPQTAPADLPTPEPQIVPAGSPPVSQPAPAEQLPQAAPPQTSAAEPAALLPLPDLTPLPAPPPRKLSDAQLAAVQASALPGPASASADAAPSDGGEAKLTSVATGALPEPAFGGSAASPATAPLPSPAPVRLALAENTTSPANLPKPEFGPAPSAPSDPAVELAASRTSALPLPDYATGPSALPLPPQDSTSAGYTNTSPRMPGAPAPIFGTDDELILQIQTQRGDLADTIIAYGTRSGVYLPLGAIARFLDLAVSVSDNGNYASGWFLDEKQTLALNLREGTLIVSGKELPLEKSDAAAFEGELYLAAERFADIFPLSLNVDLRAQTVTVKTRVPFPFEERAAREDERARLDGRGAREQKRYPREQTPWQALSVPLADVELRGVTDRTLGTRGEGDIRLAGDFAFMTARLFAEASTRDGLTGARIELGRKDPDSQLLGPLKATEFQIGDVTTSALPLGLRGTSGRGAFVTNSPLERASVFDTIDLYGDLPDGYEVELYRNNILIGSTRSPVNGQYQFLKVATEYGLNVFRLVYFGPQGQRREEVRQISVGDGRLSKGELVYTFGAAQKDTNVLGVRGPYFTPSLDFGSWRSSALMEYGLSRNLTVSLGGAWYESRFGQRWMATGGLRTGLGANALKLDLGYQSSGGKAVQVGLGGKLSGLSYTLTHGEYQGGFTDELRSFTGDPLRRSTELNLNTTIKLGGGENGKRLPIFGQLRRVEFADGRKQTDALLRASLPLKGLMLSNTLSYASTSTPNFDTTSQLRGNFDLATLSGSRLHLRAGLDYAILPKIRLEGVLLEADYALDDRTLVRATAGHTFADTQTNLGLSAVRRFGKFNLAFDGNYGLQSRDYSASLRLGFSFGRNPLNGRMFLAEPGLASGGAIAARAFRDSNGNRRFDVGEVVLPDVDFRIGSGHAKTDASGVAFIGGLGDGNRASLTSDRESLPDIALAPVNEGIEVVPRAGRVHVTDYAVQELSDIEGTAWFSEGGSLGREVSGLHLQLVDAAGKQVGRARTEGDGSFFFEQVQPGTYAIKIDPNQAASLKIRLTEPINVTIGPKSAWLKQVVKVSAD